MAVMIVEKSAFEAASGLSGSADTSIATAPARGRGRGRGRGIGGRGGHGKRGGKQGKDYAERHGQRRGWFRGTYDAAPVPDESSSADIPPDAPAEGLYALIQSTICRRLILANVFKNSPPSK